ncbi:MAG: SCE4755 family polysaccharide monooxygenase-like protein [bacterium]
MARAATVAFILASAGTASAHLALLAPVSRYGENVLKEGPCGVSGGLRSEHITTLAPGAQLEVVWDEYVDHPGHFRIAFDADGDDDFVDPACLSGCTTRTPEIETYANASVLLDGIADTPQGGISRVLVTLPDVECERCTLQVIQVMYDKPPYASPGNDIYYQCADLVLRRAAAPCAGDCDGSGAVTIDEIVRGVEITLSGAALDTCAVLDADGSGRVTVDELIAAVAAALGDGAAA